MSAQTIVNNKIPTDEIPKNLQEEINMLKIMQKIQQNLKNEERYKELLTKILIQVWGDIEFFENDDVEDVDEILQYSKECEKWFTILLIETTNTIFSKECELETFKKCTLPLEYRNITIKTDYIGNNDVIREIVDTRIIILINERYKELESTISEMVETSNISSSEKKVLLINVNEYRTSQRDYAMCVLNYKL